MELCQHFFKKHLDDTFAASYKHIISLTLFCLFTSWTCQNSNIFSQNFSLISDGTSLNISWKGMGAMGLPWLSMDSLKMSWPSMNCTIVSLQECYCFLQVCIIFLSCQKSSYFSDVLNFLNDLFLRKHSFLPQIQQFKSSFSAKFAQKYNLSKSVKELTFINSGKISSILARCS